MWLGEDSVEASIADADGESRGKIFTFDPIADEGGKFLAGETDDLRMLD